MATSHWLRLSPRAQLHLRPLEPGAWRQLCAGWAQIQACSLQAIHWAQKSLVWLSKDTGASGRHLLKHLCLPCYPSTA